MTASTPQPDTRTAQAARVADYLEQHPGATVKEIDAACDTGCITKVLSEMARPGGLGYGIGRSRPVPVPCDHGSRTRRVRTYTLTHRPGAQPDLCTNL